jgi:hypothetical protein
LLRHAERSQQHSDRNPGAILAGRAVNDQRHIAFGNGVEQAANACAHPGWQCAIQRDHRVEHSFGSSRIVRADAANRRCHDAVVPGQGIDICMGPARRLAFALFGAPQIANRAHLQIGQRRVIVVGEIGEHTGAIHLAPAGAGALLRAIAADVAKVTAALKQENAVTLGAYRGSR